MTVYDRELSRDEAHAMLDALRDGRIAMTQDQIRAALLATGDLGRCCPCVLAQPYREDAS